MEPDADFKEVGIQSIVTFKRKEEVFLGKQRKGRKKDRRKVG
jgi:hypothetical protein